MRCGQSGLGLGVAVLVSVGVDRTRAHGCRAGLAARMSPWGLPRALCPFPGAPGSRRGHVLRCHSYLRAPRGWAEAGPSSNPSRRAGQTDRLLLGIGRTAPVRGGSRG